MSTLDWLTWIGNIVAAALAFWALFVSWKVRRDIRADREYGERMDANRRRIMERIAEE